MAGRASNRERIARAAAEAEAAEKEKATARKTPGTKTSAGASPKRVLAKTTGRIRIVWIVCDQSGSPVGTFDYPKGDEARAEAERLTREKAKPHFVKRGEVPFE